MITKTRAILVIAPHADDEVLGCAGYMKSEIKKGSNVYVLFGTVGGCNKAQQKEIRMKELEKVSKHIGFDYDIILEDKDAILDTIPSFEITKVIDEKIEMLKPDVILANYPSRHQDHIKMYNCTNASMRQKNSFMPSVFALYEYPFISAIDNISGGLMYYDITEFIEDKKTALGFYKSQLKPAPSPLNENGIEVLARMRGLECGVDYAELFYVQKIVEK